MQWSDPKNVPHAREGVWVLDQVLNNSRVVFSARVRDGDKLIIAASILIA
jgi:hypothetical protein